MSFELLNPSYIFPALLSRLAAARPAPQLSESCWFSFSPFNTNSFSPGHQVIAVKSCSNRKSAGRPVLPTASLLLRLDMASTSESRSSTDKHQCAVISAVFITYNNMRQSCHQVLPWLLCLIRAVLRVRLDKLSSWCRQQKVTVTSYSLQNLC